MAEPLIPGINCWLGERVGSEDFDYTDPRCPCGCTLIHCGELGWMCSHCDDDNDPGRPCPNGSNDG